MPGARAYHHYAYKMEPQPPFRICSVSKELPLRSFDKEYHKGMHRALDQRQLQHSTAPLIHCVDIQCTCLLAASWVAAKQPSCALAHAHQTAGECRLCTACMPCNQVDTTLHCLPTAVDVTNKAAPSYLLT
jgi:hypothetical protein